MTDAGAQQDPHFLAYLRIASEELSVAEMTRVVGREPDDAVHRGEPVRNGSLRKWSGWFLNLEFEDADHRGCFELAGAIARLGDGLADRAAALEARGCTVSLQVVQYIDPADPATDGVHIDEAAIAWLARAHANLDIDQYAQDATFARAARVWLGARIWNVREVRWFVRKRLPRFLS